MEGEAATTEYDREFFLLKVQVLIFYYDVMLGMVTLARNRSSGFARCVAIKSLAHNVYEYDKQLSGTLIPRVIRAGLSDISYGNSYRTSSSRAKRMIYTSLNRSFVPAENLSD